MSRIWADCIQIDTKPRRTRIEWPTYYKGFAIRLENQVKFPRKHNGIIAHKEQSGSWFLSCPANTHIPLILD